MGDLLLTANDFMHYSESDLLKLSAKTIGVVFKGIARSVDAAYDREDWEEADKLMEEVEIARMYLSEVNKHFKQGQNKLFKDGRPDP